MATIDDCLSSGRPLAIDYRLRARTGRVVWIREVGGPVTTADGLTLWQGTFTDVTAQHETERELRQSNERFAAGFARALDSLWTNGVRATLERYLAGSL